MQKNRSNSCQSEYFMNYMFINFQCKWKRGDVEIFTCQILKDDYIFYDVL